MSIVQIEVVSQILWLHRRWSHRKSGRREGNLIETLEWHQTCQFSKEDKSQQHKAPQAQQVLSLSAGHSCDSKPLSMLTIPLLNLKDVLGWNGTDKYNVMAITFGEDVPFCQAQVLSKDYSSSGSNAQVKARIEKRVTTARSIHQGDCILQFTAPS